jgi:autotransporter-associated beta strand protein
MEATPVQGDFIKTGLGELILTGNSTHTGNTVVRGGTLTITSDLQLGPNVPTPTAGRLVIEDGGKLKINATLALDPERGIRVLGQGTIEVASGFTATYNGIITGANAGSGLIKTGAGTLVLGGAHTYSGSTDIQAGVLAVSGSLADATTVKVAQGATYQLNSSDTVAAIEGAGSITSGAVSGAVATLTVSGNTTPFSGVIGDGTAGGKLALTKVGSGTSDPERPEHLHRGHQHQCGHLAAQRRRLPLSVFQHGHGGSAATAHRCIAGLRDQHQLHRHRHTAQNRFRYGAVGPNSRQLFHGCRRPDRRSSRHLHRGIIGQRKLDQQPGQPERGCTGGLPHR